MRVLVQPNSKKKKQKKTCERDRDTAAPTINRMFPLKKRSVHLSTKKQQCVHLTRYI